MKYLFFIPLMLFSVLPMQAQEVPVLFAKQGKDASFFMAEDFDQAGEMIGKTEFLTGESWYDRAFVKSVKASSELPASGGNTYKAKNAHDFNKNTAWVEGKADYGIGESLTYTFDFARLPRYNGNLGINKILMANGYKKNRKTWANNSRVKQMKMFVNNRPYALINLLDSYEIQTVEFDKVMFPKGKVTTVRFEITQVYKGDRFKDTAISLLMFDGVGVR